MKRFYEDVSFAEIDGGWNVLLDGRAIKTAAANPQIVPSEQMAKTLSAEWKEQGDEIDLAAFRFRDLADYAIDIVAAERDAAATKLLAFAETDTLCYRADPDEELYRRQLEVWEPLLSAFETRQGITLERVSGIMHRAQSRAALGTLRARLETLDNFTLAGLQTMASLAASLCIGLTALEADSDPAALWQAANLEELWQVELWGADYEAEARLTKRGAEFLTGFDFVRLL